MLECEYLILKLADMREMSKKMSQEKMRVLKGLIHEKGKTIKGFSNELGIAESTFYRKVDGKEYGFTIREAQRIAELLALTKEETTAYFMEWAD